MLDEPTNHLDIAHQQQLLDTIRKQAVDKGLTVISVFHDINLASLYCDRLLLMEKGEIAKIGVPQDVVKEEAIRTCLRGARQNAAASRIAKATNYTSSGYKGGNQTFHCTKRGFFHSSDYVALQAKGPLKTVVLRRP